MLILILLGGVSYASAQVSFGGLLDAEIRKGEADSSPYVNQTPNGKWNIYTPYIRIFANGVISDHWFVSAALQADYYEGDELSPVFFSVINANWFPFDEGDFQVTIGRFVTPYGAYEDRILSSENPFVHLPLTHASGLAINKKLGVLPSGVSYDEITGMTMVYQRMYSQGIRISNTVGESKWFNYKLAATLSSASSNFEIGEHDYPAATGRIRFNPATWSSIGLSFSIGPFMVHDRVNTALSDSDLASYRQTLLGTDLKFSYHYYTLLLDLNWSRWSAPYVTPDGLVLDDELQAEATHFSAEGIIDFPFMVGGYAAVRYEALLAGDLVDMIPGGYSSNQERSFWTYDRHRLEVATGYKLSRNIIVKLSYLHSTDSGPDLQDDVIALQSSITF